MDEIEKLKADNVELRKVVEDLLEEIVHHTGSTYCDACDDDTTMLISRAEDVLNRGNKRGG